MKDYDHYTRYEYVCKRCQHVSITYLPDDYLPPRFEQAYCIGKCYTKTPHSTRPARKVPTQ